MVIQVCVCVCNKICIESGLQVEYPPHSFYSIEACSTSGCAIQEKGMENNGTRPHIYFIIYMKITPMIAYLVTSSFGPVHLRMHGEGPVYFLPFFSDMDVVLEF